MIRKAMVVLSLGMTLLAFSCGGGGYDSGGATPAGGASGGPTSCATGECLQNAFCCPKATPFYSSGSAYSTAGCYASCPYPGDCGSSAPQCF